jgi:phosphonate transport system substrate-binding protein
MRYAKIYAPILLIILGWLSIRPLFGDPELGSKDRPIQLMLTPSVDAERVSTGAKRLTDFLHQRTGLYFRASVPTSYIAMVEAFGAGKADLAVMNTFSYLLARSQYRAHAAMKVIRRDGETTYRGQLIARTDGGVRSMADINGKRIAYVDPASLSGCIAPRALLRREGIAPAEEVYGYKHDVVVMMVYQGQVDVGATYHSPADRKTGELLDARARVKKQFPDVFDKVRIIGMTDEMPNDPVVFREGFPADLERRIVAALEAFPATADGKKALMEIASVEGVMTTTDREYDAIDSMVRHSSVDIEAALRPRAK